MIQQYEHHIYSESSHRALYKRALVHTKSNHLKNKKWYVMCLLVKKNLIERIHIFVKIARFVPFFFASAHSYVFTPKLFRKFWQNGNHHKHLAICNRHSVKMNNLHLSIPKMSSETYIDASVSGVLFWGVVFLIFDNLSCFGLYMCINSRDNGRADHTITAITAIRFANSNFYLRIVDCSH